MKRDKMTNKELQKKTLEQIKALELTPRQYSRLPKHDKRNIFPIGTTYAYNLARGKFDQCGKHGLAAMKEYFRNLKTNKDGNN